VAKKSRKSAVKAARKPVRTQKKAAKSAAKKVARKPAKRASSLAPTPVKTGRGPTPGEIGRGLCEMINQGVGEREIWDRYWHPSVVSIEGEGVSLAWNGRKAMQAKGEDWMRTHKVHGVSADGPFVGASGFAIRFRMDVEDTSAGQRQIMEEVGVYTIQNGKIVREEFMYGPSQPVLSGSTQDLAPVGG
jgi:hypothetical protein